jgi:hypothetical protein
MSDQPKRRRFQFSLRTLMVGVTLLAVPLGYVGWLAKIVRERKTMRRILEAKQCSFHHASTFYWFGPEGSGEMATVPLVRSWLGDEAMQRILVPGRDPSIDITAVVKLFSEARVIPE